MSPPRNGFLTTSLTVLPAPVSGLSPQHTAPPLTARLPLGVMCLLVYLVTAFAIIFASPVPGPEKETMLLKEGESGDTRTR